MLRSSSCYTKESYGEAASNCLGPIRVSCTADFSWPPGDSAVAHVSCNLLMYNSRSYKHMFIAPLKIYQVRFGSFSRVKT